MTWDVILELPECEGETPLEAVRDFQAQADQKHLFLYRVRDSDGREVVVDMEREEVVA